MNENTEVLKALLEVQRELGTIGKDAANPHFKSRYATHDKILTAVLPLLNKHGLVLRQPPFSTPEGAGITTIIAHAETGQVLDMGSVIVPVDKNNAQGYGSAITYGRRFGLASAMCIRTGDDDDGNEATNAAPDDIMSVKVRIAGIIRGFGFSKDEIKNVVDHVRRHKDVPDDLDGLIVVEQFLKTLNKDTVMAFLNGDLK